MKCKSLLFACLLVISFNGYNSKAQTKKTGRPADSAFNESDTILKWRKNRQFAYMNYLDSLLKKQKYLRSDTVSFDENTGTIIRKRSSENRPSAANKVLNSQPLQVFFWVLAIAFIGFIFYKVLFENPIFKGRKKKIVLTINEEAGHVLYDLIEYDSLIAAAERNNELNSATRYLFLKTLRNLSDKGLIDYAPQKTNKDYLQEMNGNKYFNDLAKLTWHYEYAWYGKFLVDKKKYDKMKEQFYFFNEKV
jgi:hypothetical protein